MKNNFSRVWKSSRQPRKQRKYRHNAPLHLKGKHLHVNLSKDLRAKHGVRSFRLRTGDKVRILRGQFKGKEGKVEGVNLSKSTASISKIEVNKKDGSKAKIPIACSNLQILELDLGDKSRVKRLERQKLEQEKNGKKSS